MFRIYKHPEQNCMHGKPTKIWLRNFINWWWIRYDATRLKLTSEQSMEFPLTVDAMHKVLDDY